MDKWLLAMVCVIGLGYAFWQDAKYENICVGESKVKEITALRYRDADIVLENGMAVEVNQATIKPGQMYCYKYEQREVK